MYESRLGSALLLVASGAAFCQTPPPPVFDAASVRINTSATNEGSIRREGGRFTVANSSLRDLIALAYSIPTGRDYELSGPGWLDTRRYDVAATFPPETLRDRVRDMLRSLLAERFHLKTHVETRKLESYALVAAKNGPRLPAKGTSPDGSFVFGDDHIIARGFSMADLADRLSGPVFKLDRPVVDMSGIKGSYDFTLKWAPDGIGSEASIFTALQEQLGLRLVARKIAFKIVVVDQADKDPGAN
jgi:uncharacterized protein (TIGR03435 family)